MVRPARLIYNPTAGRWHDARRRVAQISRQLAGHGFDLKAAPTEGPGHAEILARRAAAEGAEIVFAYGGDGTLRECAAGLLATTTALGFLPGGTANVMARVLGLPSHPVAAAAMLASGRVEELDVGMCGTRPFLMQASAGIDAEVLGRLGPTRKRWLGRAEIALHLLPAWFSYAHPRFEVRWSSGRRTVSFAAACNVPYYGGRWRLAPMASCRDGRLDLVLFRGTGRSATLGLARDLLFGRHVDRPDVECHRVREVEMGAAEGLSLQLDGDAIPNALPARVELAATRLRVVVAHRSPRSRSSARTARG